MRLDFENLMKRRTDAELQVYLDKRSKFVPDAIEAAIKEMQARGRVFPPEELEIYQQEFQLHRDTEQKNSAEFIDFNENLNKNVVIDETAPALYSKRTIYWFTVLFSTIFGAVLLALNCRNIGSKKGSLEVLMFGTLYAFFQGFALSLLPKNSILSLGFSVLGAIILNQYFWKKYIGNDTIYRVNPIWKPLAVGVVISVVVFYAISKKLIAI